MPHGRQDHDLIAGYLSGEAGALATIDSWILPVVRHRSWRLADQQEDLLQEIRLKLLHLFEARAFRGDSSLKTYVQAASKYTCLDAVRRARIRRTEDLDGEHPSPSCDHPDEELERSDQARLCYRVLARLPETCRRMLELILVRELSYAQIADEMHISLGTVKSRLARCRDRAVELRNQMLGTRGGEA